MTKLKKLFSYEPDSGLFNAIVVRIDMERVRRAKRRFAFFAISSTLSIGAFILAIQYAIAEFAKSEFIQYFSLIFSDGTSLLSYWKQFSFVLAESIPLMSVALLLSIALITLYSLRNLLKDFGRMSYKAT